MWVAQSPVEMIPPDVETERFHPIHAGERFEFVIKYEFISAGTATLETGEGFDINGRPTLRFISKAQSNNFLDTFFKVRDYNASLIDKESFASLSFHQNLREGGYRVVRNTKRDYQQNLFSYEKFRKGKRTLTRGAMEGPSGDILSAFFEARTLPLQAGASYTLKVLSGDRYYDMRVDVDPNIETVKVPAGKFECVVIRPQAVGESIFKSEDGKILVWVTNDSRHIPVLVRSKVIIGSIDAELTSYTVPEP